MSGAYVIEGADGDVTVSAGALEQLVTQSVESVDGLRIKRRRALDVDVEDGRARVTAELAARYGVVLPEAARDAQAQTADALRRMCGLDIAAIDFSIEEVET